MLTLKARAKQPGTPGAGVVKASVPVDSSLAMAASVELVEVMRQLQMIARMDVSPVEMRDAVARLASVAVAYRAAGVPMPNLNPEPVESI